MNRRPAACGEVRARGDGVVLEVMDVSSQRLTNVNLTVHRGEVVGVTGLIGSGRSELGRIVYGLQSRTGGRGAHQRQTDRSGARVASEASATSRKIGARVSFPRYRFEENITITAAERLNQWFGLSPKRVRDAALQVIRSFQIRPADPRGLRRHPVGRQPAEGRARQVAAIAARSHHSRRADPGDRHRHETGPDDDDQGARAGRGARGALARIGYRGTRQIRRPNHRDERGTDERRVLRAAVQPAGGARRGLPHERRSSRKRKETPRMPHASSMEREDRSDALRAGLGRALVHSLQIRASHRAGRAGGCLLASQARHLSHTRQRRLHPDRKRGARHDRHRCDAALDRPAVRSRRPASWRHSRA